MRFRVAEVDDQPVAEYVGDPPLEPLDHALAGFVVRVHDLAVVLGIEDVGQTRRTDEIAEQNRHAATFARHVATFAGGFESLQASPPDVWPVYVPVKKFTPGMSKMS